MRLPCRAFTLTELFVTIAIIGALAAILFPVTVSAHRQGRKTSCLYNLDQIGKAISLYANDYDGLLPYSANSVSQESVRRGLSVYGQPLDGRISAAPTIDNVLLPYISAKDMFRCPDDVMPDFLRENQVNGATCSTFYEAYGSSYDYDERHALTLRALNNYPNPSENILVSDGGSFHSKTNQKEGLTNVLYADFHVKTISWNHRTRALDADP